MHPWQPCSHRVFGFTHDDNSCCLTMCRPGGSQVCETLCPHMLGSTSCPSRVCTLTASHGVFLIPHVSFAQREAAFWMPIRAVAGSVLSGTLASDHGCCTKCCAPCPCFSDTDTELEVGVQFPSSSLTVELSDLHPAYKGGLMDLPGVHAFRQGLAQVLAALESEAIDAQVSGPGWQQ